MKKLILLLFVVSRPVFAQDSAYRLPFIPLPADISYSSGQFVLSSKTKIVLQHEQLRSDVEWFNDYLEGNYGFHLDTVTHIPNEGNYIILIVPGVETGEKEKYQLHIRPALISVAAESNGAGFFYAFQTLLQLLPNRDAKAASPVIFKLPCVSIKDSPRFKWRGMHLDVCRHFFPVSFVKKYMGLMAQYKMNTFHWHLTDDQGWRIEIKKYPLLTSVGGWRSGTMVGKYSNQTYDTIRYGGFYTQEELKDVIAYAQKLHITIVPEIEMPGHSMAAIAAYPWLSCTGKPQQVAKGWGVFDDVFCSKDSTINFMKDVLQEVMALFPGKYIHIGGDECPKTRWKTCKNCQSVIAKENLKDEHELQSYFIKQIEKFVNANGKQIIGWDEILEGGLAPNATVMSWRGEQGGIEAARQKHFVVMTPGKPCYFDHYQSKDKTKEPLAIGGYNPVDSVYKYDPQPAALNAEGQKHILGAQGNVWTEYILDEKQLEYMAIPRMCALAEAVWTPKEKKNLENFRYRLKINSKKLAMQNVNYAKHFISKK